MFSYQIGRHPNVGFHTLLVKVQKQSRSFSADAGGQSGAGPVGSSLAV